MQWQATQKWLCWIAGGLVAGGFAPSLAATTHSDHPTALPGHADAADYIRPEVTCPDNLESLTAILLRDLPSYANRVSQRARNRERSLDVFGYVLLAGRPEFEPLSLGPGEYTPTAPEDDPDQVFFTTLERQYVTGEVVQFQHYHWLFLTQAESGWRFVLMLSQIGSPSDEPPSPPTDTSNGVIGRAIQTWLRDCRAGDIQPL
ncbi:hypothetical protein [Oculatella sp. FACHB-28]|uniref:hypothetical protein n=1 Tax=Oculatella sp. FACHB-28 TaxID=2692845 RepID=UPI0018EF95E5|nr:hypothetical protein [Oculatella sp. FACHB-28]